MKIAILLAGSGNRFFQGARSSAGTRAGRGMHSPSASHRSRVADKASADRR